MKKAPHVSVKGYDCAMNWLLALFLKPFIAVAFFMVAWLISRLFWRYIPDGKIKKILFSPLPGHRKG
jgi:hypothetical protein